MARKVLEEGRRGHSARPDQMADGVGGESEILEANYVGDVAGSAGKEMESGILGGRLGGGGHV